MKLKIAKSLIIIALAAALVGGATMAWFTDEADISAATFTAGTVKIEAGQIISMEGDYCRVKEGLYGPAYVVSYRQGHAGSDPSAGLSVRSQRSNPNAVLTLESGQNEANFFSLGFGGEIVVKFDYLIHRGDSFVVVVEDTWGNSFTYPEETANVFISQNGSNWYFVGQATSRKPTANQNVNEFEIDNSFPIEWAQYVKVVDTSNPADFASISNQNTVDGFDVNAILVKDPVVCDEENWNPGDCNQIVYYIDNVGTKGIFARAELIGQWLEFDEGLGQWIPWTPEPDEGVVSINLCEDESEGWTYENGFFYYNNVLGGTYDTGIGEGVRLCVKVCLDGEKTDNQYQGKKFVMSAGFEAVQSSNNASVSVWGWSPAGY